MAHLNHLAKASAGDRVVQTSHNGEALADPARAGLNLASGWLRFAVAIWADFSLGLPQSNRRNKKGTIAMAELRINGTTTTVDAPDDMPLLWVIRDLLGLTGTKFGCGIAQCGACTVHLDGKPVRSCMLPIGSVGDRAITTIEAIGNTPVGQKVQKAWLDLEVVQCGYCQSGQIMSAAALLATTPQPTDADIDAAMAGNICRCGTYVRIRAAIKSASGPSSA